MFVEHSGFQKEPTRRRSLRRAGVGAGLAVVFGVVLLGSGVGTAAAATDLGWQENPVTTDLLGSNGGILELLNNARYYGVGALSQSDWVNLSDQMQNVLAEYTNSYYYVTFSGFTDIQLADGWLHGLNLGAGIPGVPGNKTYLENHLPGYISAIETWAGNGTWWVLYAPAMLFADMAANGGTPSPSWCSQLPTLIPVHQVIDLGLSSGIIPNNPADPQLNTLFDYLSSVEGLAYQRC